MEFQLDKGLEVLDRTPGVFRQMLSGLDPAWTDADEGPETFSPYIVVGHLIHGDRTDWMARAEIILAQGANRRFEPYDRFAQLHESEGKTLDDLLSELEDIRAINLVKLRSRNLTKSELALEGEHPKFGAVTLRQLLATWVAHDLSHIAQTARVMAKQYRDAIGPWREYMPLMDR